MKIIYNASDKTITGTHHWKQKTTIPRDNLFQLIIHLTVYCDYIALLSKTSAAKNLINNEHTFSFLISSALHMAHKV